MEYWIQRYGDYDFQEQVESSGPKPLTLDHLLGAFELCGVLVVTSFVVFLIELLVFRSSSKKMLNIFGTLLKRE